MGKRIKKLKKIRIHHEGTDTLLYGFLLFIGIAAGLWFAFETKWPFWLFIVVYGFIYGIVAPADGKIVVVEEVDEKTYFHDRRIMISIFMSVTNVHANWFPVDGKVKFVKHFNGNFHKAWLPKASEENEHADTMITTPDGTDILCRQIAGAVARRIVTYAREGEECFIDEHLGFIKLGSRVDVFLPVDSEVCVTMGQKTTGDQTIIARLRQ